MRRHQPTVFVSNRFEILTKHLGHNLFLSHAKPFKNQLVLLPNLNMKNELMVHLLAQKDIDIVTGVSFLEMGTGIRCLYQKLSKRSLSIPFASLLSLHLEHEVKRALKREDPLFAPVVQYLNLKHAHPKRLDKQIQTLCDALSLEFLQYGKYGGDFLKTWQSKQGWQQALWNAVFSHWNYPYEVLDEKNWGEKEDSTLEVHVFGFSFLPKLYQKFFEKIAPIWEINFYFLSPCQMYWGDLHSEKTRFFLMDQWEQRGMSHVQQKDLDAFLKNRNLFLANFGKLGQMTFLFFQDHDVLYREEYQEITSKQTLLQGLQDDLLNMKNPEVEGKTVDLCVNRSIECHCASSKLREMEILFSNLMQLLYEQKGKNSSKTIHIFAPEISDYAPYIHLVFGAKHSPFSYQISHLEKESQSLFLQGMDLLLSLGETRFESSFVFKLLNSPLFSKKFHLKPEDLLMIYHWIKQSGVTWGFDQSHRNEILSKVKEGEKMLDTKGGGTWEEAFYSLLSHLVSIPYGENVQPSYWPLWIDFSSSELLGTFIDLVQNLREDVKILEKESMTLHAWCHYLVTLSKRYFVVPEEEQEFYAFFLDKLEALKELGSHLNEEVCTFGSIRRYLTHAFKEKKGVFKSKSSYSLQFSSLTLGCFTSSHITALIGMDEDHFPHSVSHHSIDEMEGKKDPCPTVVDEERYLFLEGILATRENLLMSYVSLDEKDGKEKGSSLFIQDLFSYLDQAFEIHKQKPSPLITFHHPPFSFHASYFQTKENQKPFSLLDYEMAKSFYAPHEKAARPLVPELLEGVNLNHELGAEEDYTFVLNINTLESLAKNPFRFFLNTSLGLYLKDNHFSLHSHNEEFVLSSLSQALIKKGLFDQKSLLPLIDEARMHGKLPLGPFEQVACLKLNQDVLERSQQLANFGLCSKDVMIVEMKEGVQKKEQIGENKWLIPPLEIDFGAKEKGKIIGSLPPISHKGILFFGEKNWKDCLATWPLTLLCLTLPKEIMQPQILGLKKGKAFDPPKHDPIKLLKSYLLYFKHATKSPSPLFPLWSKSLLTQTDVEFEKDIHRFFHQTQGFVDPYLKWVFNQKSHYNPKVIFSSWSSYLRSSFTPLIEWLS